MDNEIDKAGHKKAKGEAAMISAKKRAMAKYVDGADAKGLYRDPAAMFETG